MKDEDKLIVRFDSIEDQERFVRWMNWMKYPLEDIINLLRGEKTHEALARLLNMRAEQDNQEFVLIVEDREGKQS